MQCVYHTPPAHTAANHCTITIHKCGVGLVHPQTVQHGSSTTTPHQGHLDAMIESRRSLPIASSFASLVLTGPHWSSLVLTGPHWSSLVLTGPHWSSLVLTGPLTYVSDTGVQLLARIHIAPEGGVGAVNLMSSLCLNDVFCLLLLFNRVCSRDKGVTPQ